MLLELILHRQNRNPDFGALPTTISLEQVRVLRSRSYHHQTVESPEIHALASVATDLCNFGSSRPK